MSLVSRCRPAASRPSALPSPEIVQTLLLLALFLGFGLAHIHLRVRLGEVRGEIGRLQNDQTRFIAEINSAVAENESLRNPRNLQAYAIRELGMAPYDPAGRQAIAMPEEIRSRYALARATGGDLPAQTEMAQGERATPILASLGERIGLIGDAQAEEPAR